MPNTLAHIAVQGVANSSWQPSRYIPWVLLGCVLPDITWIANRILRSASPDIDVVALDLYCFVQASWSFSALLAVAFAAFASRPLAAWLVASGNAFLHLLLDAVEIKPGSGVHLFAPWSWQSTSFDLVWPEHPAVTAVTLLGIVVAVALLVLPRFRPPGERLIFAGRRYALALGAVVAYLVLPLHLTDGPWIADYRSIRSLATSEISVRSPVELERDPVTVRDGQPWVQVFGREFRVIADREIPDGAVVSLVGYLSAPTTIRATELHLNDPGPRDLASIAGLLVVAIVWLRLLASSLQAARRPWKRAGASSSVP